MKLAEKVLSRFGFGRTAPLRAENNRLRTALQREQVRGFAAAQTNRLVEDWLTTRTTINNLLESGIGPLRARSRELVRENDYAKAFRRMFVNNVVGPDGFKLDLDIRDDNGKMDQRAVDIIKKAWDKWCKKQNCTVSEEMSFHSLCTTLVGEVPAAGGFLIRMHKGHNNPFGFALEPIELDCLDENKNLPWNGSTFTRMGVEMNKFRKRVNYHLMAENPYDHIRSGRGRYTSAPESAELILHGFIPLELGQVRELPLFHTSMIGLQMLGGYNEAALVAARVGAQKMGFLERTPDAAGNYQGDALDADGNRLTDGSPGQIEELPLGTKFASWDPSYPHAEHGSFNKAILRGLSAGLGCAYNSLANDLEGVNYSSIRAGLLDERDQWKLVQRWFCDSLLDPIFPHWLDMAMMTGEVALPQYKFEKFNKPCFMGRRWPWVDPVKDMEAAALGIKHFITTRTDVVAEMGGSFEQNVATTEADNALLAKAGLKSPEQVEAESEKAKTAAPKPAPAQEE